LWLDREAAQAEIQDMQERIEKLRHRSPA
jgi:hypothetical protein